MRWQHYTKPTDTIDEFPLDERPHLFMVVCTFYMESMCKTLYILMASIFPFFSFSSLVRFHFSTRSPWLCFSFPFRRFNMAFVKFNKHDRIFRIFYLVFFFSYSLYMVWLVYCFMSCDIDIEIFCIFGYTIVDGWICRIEDDSGLNLN